MKRFLRVVLFALVALPTVCPALVEAADHREAPLVNGRPQGDIGDVFAYLDPCLTDNSMTGDSRWSE